MDKEIRKAKAVYIAISVFFAGALLLGGMYLPGMA